MSLKRFAQRILFMSRCGTTVALPMTVGAKLTASGDHIIHPEIKQWLAESCSGEWQFKVNLGVYCTEYRFERNSDAVLFKMTWA